MPIRVVICRSNPLAPDPRVEKIAMALHRSGFMVRLIGWDRSGELPPYEQWTDAAPATALSEQQKIEVFRLPLVAPFGHGLGNLPNLIRWQLRLFQWLIKQRKHVDIVHACDFDTILPALLVKMLYGKKVVYDIFDFYADHLRATPHWIKKTIRFVDKRAIFLADALIIADDSRWAQVSDSSNNRPRRCTVIYNSPRLEDLPQVHGESDTNEFQPGAIDSAKGDKQQSPKLRLAYIGLLQRERGLVEMMSVLRSHPEWFLDLAGFGGDEEMLVEMAKSMPNVRWHGRIPYRQTLLLSQAANVLFATYDPAIPNHRFSSPNKVFEAMLLGRPIIVARGTNMDQIVERAGCGIVVEYGQMDELEAALLRLQGEPGLSERLGRNAFNAYQETYSWDKMEARLRNLYQAVIDDTDLS